VECVVFERDRFCPCLGVDVVDTAVVVVVVVVVDVDIDDAEESYREIE
jgi:hypothetical protein